MASQTSYSMFSALEAITASKPNDTFVIIPTGANETQMTKITNTAMLNAVYYAAWWIHNNIGSSTNNETIAYIGPSDLRYAILTIAAVPTGHKIMLPSPRNSLDGQRHLIQATECTSMLHTKETSDIVSGLQDLPHLTHFEIPALSEFLVGGSTTYVPQNSKYEEEDTKVLILHTSGSTGLPKPIYHTNGSVRALGRLNELAIPKGRGTVFDDLYHPAQDRPVLTTMPFFHIFSLITIVRAVFHGAPFVLPPPSTPINSNLVVDLIKTTKPWACVVVPSILDDIGKRTDALEVFGSLEYFIFGGAPLAPTTARLISQVSRPANVYGSTEMGAIAALEPLEKDETEFFEWASGLGVVMKPYSEGVSELVIEKTPEKTFQPCFHIFPELNKWESKDLFEQHPANAKLWRYVGRKDDIVVLSNGEMFTPVDFEKKVETHARVKGAIVAGTGKFQASLLVEPDWTLIDRNKETPESILLDVWATVKEANKLVPSHGQIWKSKIALTRADIPFQRLPKGSIMRRATLQDYEKEIDALYVTEELELNNGPSPDDLSSPEGKVWLKDAIRQVFVDRIPDLEGDFDDTSIFASGADSLHVLGIATSLSHVIPLRNGAESGILPSTVYKYPTINKLVDFLSRPAGEPENLEEDQRVQKEAINSTIKKFTKSLPSRKPHVSTTKSGSQTVILTGSTGSLGRQVLHELLQIPEVVKIICLNRSSDAKPRQTRSHSEYGLNTDFTKVQFLQADFSKPTLGLDDPAYRSLLSEATVIVHNAWDVNFNQPLSSFETTHIAGVRHLIDFSISSKAQARIVFISSISGVFNWRQSHETSVPEQLFDDPSLPLGQGYGESKFVAEQILSIASQKSGVPSTVMRLGQIAGVLSGNGLWNPQEWFPSLAKSSFSLQCIPESLGVQDNIAWVPMDITAKMVVETSLREPSEVSNTDVVHVSNPHSVQWSMLREGIREFSKAKDSQALQVAPMKEWLLKLRNVPSDQLGSNAYPAAKLAEFYEQLPGDASAQTVLDTSNSLKASPALRSLGPIDEALMTRWLEQWRRHDEDAKKG